MTEPRPTFPKRRRIPREHVVKIRFSEAERQRLEALAEQSGYTLAALLRDQFGLHTTLVQKLSLTYYTHNPPST
jgi:hypothetical protein